MNTTQTNSKKIKLTQGQYALVDADDFERVNQYKWCAHRGMESFYAIRDIVINSKRKKTINMTNFIMKVYNRLLLVDHINHNTLDNRKCNLRLCTHQQNMFNRKKRKNTTSKYKGVVWYRTYKKWHAKTVKTLESFVPIVIGNQKYSVIEKVKKFLGETFSVFGSRLTRSPRNCRRRADHECSHTVAGTDQH